MFVDGVAQVTAEDAADRVTRTGSAAWWKWLVVVAGRLSPTERTEKAILASARRRILQVGRCMESVLFLYEELELICVLRCLILHGVVIDVEFCRFGPVLTTQLELELFPGIILADLVFLRVKKIKMR